jgi:hypothetical protein
MKVPEPSKADVAIHADILGFKNATTCATLLVDVPPLLAGQRVFVKIGKSQDDCDFTDSSDDRLGSIALDDARQRARGYSSPLSARAKGRVARSMKRKRVCVERNSDAAQSFVAGAPRTYHRSKKKIPR